MPKRKTRGLRKTLRVALWPCGRVAVWLLCTAPLAVLPLHIHPGHGDGACRVSGTWVTAPLNAVTRRHLPCARRLCVCVCVCVCVCSSHRTTFPERPRKKCSTQPNIRRTNPTVHRNRTSRRPLARPSVRGLTRPRSACRSTLSAHYQPAKGTAQHSCTPGFDGAQPVLVLGQGRLVDARLQFSGCLVDSVCISESACRLNLWWTSSPSGKSKRLKVMRLISGMMVSFVSCWPST